MNKFNANIQHNNYLGTLEIIKIILSTWIACYIHIRITTYISVLIIFFVIFLLNLIVLKKSTNKVHFSHEIESSFFGVVQRFFLYLLSLKTVCANLTNVGIDISGRSRLSNDIFDTKEREMETCSSILNSCNKTRN